MLTSAVSATESARFRSQPFGLSGIVLLMTQKEPAAHVARFLALLCLSLAASAQSPAPAEQTDQGLILRFDVNVVQVDAVVTDRSGRPVADLHPGDFEVLQDGKPQQITYFSFVHGAVAQGPVKGRTVESGAGASSQPPKQLMEQDVRRTTVFVIDDSGMVFPSFATTQLALQRYARDVMHEGDEVAVIRIYGRTGFLDQLTSDRRQFLSAVTRMVWEPPSSRRPKASAMEVISDLTRSLAAIPGRKAIVLISDAMFTGGPKMYELMRAAADRANRASIVIEEIKPAGLKTLMSSAEDGKASQQSHIDGPSEWGYRFLAKATGGDSYAGNGTFGAMARAAANLDEYYVLGWNPGADAFPGRSLYHKLHVRVLRSGLEVRSRAGFFGEPGNLVPPGPASLRDQVDGALFSDFRLPGIGLGLTAGFRPQGRGGLVDALLHVDVNSLDLRPDVPPGCEGANIEMIYTLQPLDNNAKARRSETSNAVHIGGCGERLAFLKAHGFVGAVTIPVDEPGAYRLRFAVRVIDSGPAVSVTPKRMIFETRLNTRIRLGAVSQYLAIPDARKSPASVTSLFVGDGIATDAGPGVMWRGVKDRDPAVRVFRAGDELRFRFDVTGKEVRTVRPEVVLEYEGKRVETLKASAGSAEAEFTPFSGQYRVSPGIVPGFYRLGVVLAGPVRGGAAPIPTREMWTDIEIVP